MLSLIIVRVTHKLQRSFSADGSGDGPRRALIREALLILLSDTTLWVSREGYLVPNWHSSVDPIPSRVSLFRAAGALMMLHFLWNGAPSPLSPFLALLVFDGIRSFNNDASFLQKLITPTVLHSIAEWESLPSDEPYTPSKYPSAAALFEDVSFNVRHTIAMSLIYSGCS